MFDTRISLLLVYAYLIGGFVIRHDGISTVDEQDTLMGYLRGQDTASLRQLATEEREQYTLYGSRQPAVHHNENEDEDDDDNDNDDVADNDADHDADEPLQQRW